MEYWSTEYPVGTRDDKVVSVFRYRKEIDELSSDFAIRNRPVLLCPGLGVNHKVFDFDPSETLALYLVKAGFDVWGVDLRKDRNSVDEYIKFDIPACISHILNATGADELHFVGHSMGCTLGFAQLASPFGVHISSLLALSGGCHYQNSAWRLLKPMLPLFRLSGTIPLHTLSQMSSGQASWFGGLARFAVNGRNLAPKVLSELMAKCFHSLPVAIADQMLTLLSPEGLVASFFDAAPPPMTFTIADDSPIALIDGDDDGDCNGGTNKPVSPGFVWEDMMLLCPVETPILAILGDADMQVKEQDVQRTLDATKSPRCEMRVLPGYGHFDTVVGENARRDIYPLILEFLSSMDGGGGGDGDKNVDVHVDVGKVEVEVEIEEEVEEYANANTLHSYCNTPPPPPPIPNPNPLPLPPMTELDDDGYKDGDEVVL